MITRNTTSAEGDAPSQRVVVRRRARRQSARGRRAHASGHGVSRRFVEPKSGVTGGTGPGAGLRRHADQPAGAEAEQAHGEDESDDTEVPESCCRRTNTSDARRSERRKQNSPPARPGASRRNATVHAATDGAEEQQAAVARSDASEVGVVMVLLCRT